MKCLTGFVLALAVSLASCVAPQEQAVESPSHGESVRVSGSERPTGEAGLGTSGEPASLQPKFDVAAWLGEQDADPDGHGALVETLEPGRVIASHNADKKFNPASLVKLATTLVALRRLGPDYRFRIHVYADGVVDDAGTLHGQLYFMGSAPTFGDIGANMIAKELEGRGIKALDGRVNVSPDFCFNLSESPQKSAARLAKALRLEKSPETAVTNAPAGTLIFTFDSHPLREILLYMNAHSSNFVAHRVGDRVGGAKGVERFLEEEVSLPPEEVNLSTTSGLEHNEMTARGVARVLRALVAEAGRHGMRLADLLPVANGDTGTLRRRFGGTGLEKAALGKSGTLTTTDGGMASLAGIIYTEGDGPLLFVVLDQGTLIWKSRQRQEQLLAAVLEGRARPQPVNFEVPRDLLSSGSMGVRNQGTISRARPAGSDATTAE